MCGIAGIVGHHWKPSQLSAMMASQYHRGPDATGSYLDPHQTAGLGHNRLSIIDLSDDGVQPMSSHDGNLKIVFNGEIYNYLELKQELSEYEFRTRTDTEVILAAYERWGERCLEHFVGMFSFLIWDERERRLFGARDRFGVKPFYYHQTSQGTLFVASEIKALHAAGVEAADDLASWATYLTRGAYDHSEHTFWKGVMSLPPGHQLVWKNNRLAINCWYDLAARVGPQYDTRPVHKVRDEYLALLKESVRLRFRADVPVGINLSGGLDSSTLLGLVEAMQGDERQVKVFTFATGDPAYDEVPWVQQMLNQTSHPLTICQLTPEEVPALAESVQRHQDEPFGGLPTLAYARLFEQARAEGVIVLLDGQGMDEQWAGYDYYAASPNGAPPSLVQGTKESAVRPACLEPDFAALARPLAKRQPFSDRLRNMQYRDTRYTKIPRALRFNDRVSMRSSTELREPFLDHRLFELAMRQPAARKIVDGIHKWLLRDIVRKLLPSGVVEAPKRPLQTPQREWLRGPLRTWAGEQINQAISARGQGWLRKESVPQEWDAYCSGASDNSFYVWQWISLGMLSTTEHVQARADRLSASRSNSATP